MGWSEALVENFISVTVTTRHTKPLKQGGYRMLPDEQEGRGWPTSSSWMGQQD